MQPAASAVSACACFSSSTEASDASEAVIGVSQAVVGVSEAVLEATKVIEAVLGVSVAVVRPGVQASSIGCSTQGAVPACPL